MIAGVRVELSYAKNETELSRSRVKKLEEEIEEHKERAEALEQELDASQSESWTFILFICPSPFVFYFVGSIYVVNTALDSHLRLS